jgi:xanthine/CO dehydrogenase XdhC/CoxF family maturation factor
MRDIIDEIAGFLDAGEQVAVATVVKTEGSVPRPAGSSLALTASGQVAGSISGGCLEAEVIEEGREVIETGRPKLLHYGISDEMAWSVGLSCGGEVDIFIERIDG